MSKQRSFLNLRSVRTSAAPPPEAVSIDGYRIESLLGVGPLTAVYRAVLESHQQAVAVKVLLPHLADSEVFAQRFLQAANAARLVTHDRVLPCYDVGQANGWVYLAGELFEGRSLSELLGSDSMDNARSIYLAWQISMGLEAIHAAGLVHGNLRPSNVLVDDEDGVRLADLGLPVLADGDPSSTQAGGGALHLPPEAVGRECAPDIGGDLYALGIILLGMLIGRTPWAGVSRQRLSELHAGGDSVMSEAPTQLDGDLRAVLVRATASHPGERYRHAFQLREDLERLQYGFAPIHARSLQQESVSPARDSGLRSVRRETEVAGTTVRRPGRGRLIIAGVVILAIVGLAAAVLLNGRDDTKPAPRSVVVSAPAPVPIPVPVPGPAAPTWAVAAGTDQHGRWCDLDVHGRKLRFRLIHAGSFWMGSPLDEVGRAADEDRHLVTISRDFWLGDSEVTQEAFVAVMGSSPSNFSGSAFPVESVSWNTVQDFLARLGGESGAPARLPTEAEWEYACRAGSTGTATVEPEQAWTAALNLSSPQPVHTRKANAWGLFDMQGNVAEWVEDTYGRFRREPAADPVATGGVHRIIRGGAWNMDASDARPAARGKALPTTAYFHLGFRLAINDVSAPR